MDRFGSVELDARTLPGTWQIQVARYLRRLLRNLELSETELAEYRSKRLVALIRHAATTVPLYAKLYAGVDWRDCRSVDDLTRLPPVSKEVLLAQPERDRVSSTCARERLVRVSTGGTTGQRLDVFLAPAYAQRRTAEGYRVLVTNGYRPWDRIGVLSQRPVSRRWYHGVGLLRLDPVPVTWSIAEQQRALARQQPAIIEGYPSRLLLVADRLALGYRPKAVLSHSETLAPLARERLERAFGVPVSNVYETWECGRIAWEFPGSRGLVLGLDSHVVEVIDGEVCVTDLHNLAMPLIRYRTGDRAELSSDRSGGLRRLENVDGRMSDYLVLPDGTRTPLMVVFHALVRVPGVGAFQLRRCGRDALNLLLLPASDYSSRTEAAARDVLVGRFGFRDVKVEKVDALPRTASGKLRWLVDDSDA